MTSSSKLNVILCKQDKNLMLKFTVVFCYFENLSLVYYGLLIYFKHVCFMQLTSYSILHCNKADDNCTTINCEPGIVVPYKQITTILLLTHT